MGESQRSERILGYLLLRTAQVLFNSSAAAKFLANYSLIFSRFWFMSGS